MNSAQFWLLQTPKDAERCRKHGDFRVPATSLSARSRIWVRTRIISSPVFKSCFASKTLQRLTTVRIAQTCFCRSGGFAPVSFPLFQGIRLGVGSSKFAISCMVALLGYRGGLACLGMLGAEILSPIGLTTDKGRR